MNGGQLFLDFVAISAPVLIAAASLMARRSAAASLMARRRAREAALMLFWQAQPSPRSPRGESRKRKLPDIAQKELPL